MRHPERHSEATCCNAVRPDSSARNHCLFHAPARLFGPPICCTSHKFDSCSASTCCLSGLTPMSLTNPPTAVSGPGSGSGAGGRGLQTLKRSVQAAFDGTFAHSIPFYCPFGPPSPVSYVAWGDAGVFRAEPHLNPSPHLTTPVALDILLISPPLSLTCPSHLLSTPSQRVTPKLVRFSSRVRGKQSCRPRPCPCDSGPPAHITHFRHRRLLTIDTQTHMNVPPDIPHVLA